MKRILMLACGIVVLCLTARDAPADNFWCGGRLVSVSLTKYEILRRCGEPDHKDFRYERRIRRDFYRDLFIARELRRFREGEGYREPLFVEEEVLIEEWTYNLGPTRFIRYLIFEDGRLVNIFTGGYGF